MLNIQSLRSARCLRLLFLQVLLVVAWHPQAAFAENKVVTNADKGGDIHLKVGDTLEVRLKSNPTTGFAWYLHKESTPVLKLVHQTATEPTDQSADPSVGRPVFQIFNFEPRRSGDGVLVLHYVRSWDKPSPDEEQFKIHVIVE